MRLTDTVRHKIAAKTLPCSNERGRLGCFACDQKEGKVDMSSQDAVGCKCRRAHRLHCA